jgi:hypothetical protein
MSKTVAGNSNTGKYPGMNAHDAAQLAHKVMLTAANDMTAIAYIDAVSLSGQNWLKTMGMHIDFSNESVLYTTRILVWNGTPYMNLSDLSEVLALVGPYNAFDPAHVINVLAGLTQRYPKFSFVFRLAREYSPAIYVREVDYNKLDDSEIQRVGAEMFADEANYIGMSELHFWFD